MKKLFIAVFAVLSFASLGAQNFSAGINVGLPNGDAADLTTFVLGLDVNAMWEVSDSFDAGIATGFSNFFGDDLTVGTITVEIEDYQYIPLAAAGRFSLSDKFTLGADVGYAIAISDGDDGGFYYAPTIGYGLGENTNLNLSYRGVSQDGGTISSVNLGVMFGF